ncbi:hypothetical protein HPP92_018735 [Vanilla planifolia]|uniref:Uncharacterized protein n=1 Tax=Vanilla planifolia TaxID=51239 RepID=A0A835PAJ8_VANPL|nr:hypothetical protein HPP92_027071 [Vanilla planifolia]KAG0464571.1 hypothetical protein HPP92_018735 [Vanilla planifolia]
MEECLELQNQEADLKGLVSSTVIELGKDDKNDIMVFFLQELRLKREKNDIIRRQHVFDRYQQPCG